MKPYIQILATALCLLPGIAFGQAAAKPMVATQIQSQRLEVQNDGEKAYFHFVERVLLTATNMQLECDELEVFAIRKMESEGDIGEVSSIQEIIASGNVKIVQAERTATCEKAVVRPDAEHIVLSGSPVVIQPGGRIQTYNPEDEIILDRGNGRIKINAKGPRRIKLTSSAIGDLGFEDQGAIPTPPEEPETPDTTEETSPETEADDADATTTEPEVAPEAPEKPKDDSSSRAAPTKPRSNKRK